MENKQKDMEELLKAELKKEEEKILEEIAEDKSLENVSVPEDLDNKLIEMIREYEAQQNVYDMLSEKDKEALRLGREMQALRENGKDIENDTEDKEEPSPESVSEFVLGIMLQRAA